MYIAFTQTRDVDVDNAVQQLDQLEPLVVIVVTPGVDATTLIYNEGRYQSKVASIKTGIVYAFACYFIFDICYPKSNLPFLFFQHCVFKIDELDNPPTALAKLIHLMSTKL